MKTASDTSLETANKHITKVTKMVINMFTDIWLNELKRLEVIVGSDNKHLLCTLTYWAALDCWLLWVLINFQAGRKANAILANRESRIVNCELRIVNCDTCDVNKLSRHLSWKLCRSLDRCCCCCCWQREMANILENTTTIRTTTKSSMSLIFKKQS